MLIDDYWQMINVILRWNVDSSILEHSIIWDYKQSIKTCTRGIKTEIHERTSI